MAASSIPNPTSVVPAQLGFFAIFNPSLGLTDETMDDQIVYYASVKTPSLRKSQRRRHRSSGNPLDGISQDERNERLRQIGLAQGMVEFSRGFSNGEPVDTIETEKTRVVLQEIEPGWWILASIDLTRIPLPPRIGASSESDQLPENVEYSSRELKPSMLLTRDLLRAHSMFLLHHASSLSALFVRSRRSNFIKVLGRFWDLFLSSWDVMLHGNPASNVFGGIKIAACGELGVGVGEENRGSGERDVLEGFVERVEGLTDLVVSRFGPSEPTPSTEPTGDGKSDLPPTRWLGTGEEAGAEDGAIFLGVGTLSRKSLRDLTYWMEDIYTWGENAYGVKESPSSTRQTKRPRKSINISRNSSIDHTKPSGAAMPLDHDLPTSNAIPQNPNESVPSKPGPDDGIVDDSNMTRLMGYLKMGYGTHWSLGASEDTAKASSPTQESAQSAKTGDSGRPNPSDNCGRYLIGLLGNMQEPGPSEGQVPSLPDHDTEILDYNSRILLRTLTVELEDKEQTEARHVEDLGSQTTELTRTRSGRKDSADPHSRFDSQDRNKTQKMRVVVYVNEPFIFAFLFRNRTDSLAWDGLYRSLHHQLGPLRKPLALSTSYRPDKPDTGDGKKTSAAASHIFDLVWDPNALTVHSTIPNIPTPAEALRAETAGSSASVWSRAEAVNTHNQILQLYSSTLASNSNDASELERTCKTNRGWWVVWSRVLERSDPPQQQQQQGKDSDSEESSATVTAPSPPGGGEDDRVSADQSTRQSGSQASNDASPSPGPDGPAKPALVPKPKVNKEIFLIRRAGSSSHAEAGSSSTIGGAISGGVTGGGGGSGSWAEGAGRLAQGIGVDTHKYIEDLLNMGR